MKSIVVALTIGGNKQNAILKTNDDGKSSKFTIMQVEKPAGLTDNDFPFHYGQVVDIQEVINTLAILDTTGVLSIDSVSIEDANTKGSLSLDDAPIFEFELYDNTDTKTGEGKLFMPGRQYIAYDEIEFLTNTDTSNVGTSYLIPNSATPDGETLYELYNFSYAPVGLKVKIMAKPAPPVPVPAKITITENGENIDVSEYELADVDVPQPSGNIEITENGQGIDIAQYATADVNVPAAEEATKVAIIVDKGTESIYNEDNELVPLTAKVYTVYGLSYQNVDIPALSGSGGVNFAVNSSAMDDQTYGTWIWLSPVDGILWDDLTQFSLEDNLSHQSTTIQDIQYIKETPSNTSKFGVAIRAKLTGDTNIFYKGKYITQIMVV